MFRLMTLCAVTFIAMTAGASAEFLAERGAYLVNGVGACNNCHTRAGRAAPRTCTRQAALRQHADLPGAAIHGEGLRT